MEHKYTFKGLEWLNPVALSLIAGAAYEWLEAHRDLEEKRIIYACNMRDLYNDVLEAQRRVK